MRLPMTISLAVFLGWLGIGGCTAGTAITPTDPDDGPVTVTAVTVTPAIDTVVIGSTVRLSAQASTLDNRPAPAVLWRSLAPSVASVDGGVVTGVSAGSARILAEAGAKVGIADVVVIRPPVASVSLTPASVSLAVGASMQLSVVTRDANGDVLTGRAVAWISSSPSVASVSPSGVVAGVAAGSVSITATSEGRSASSSVTVTSVAAPVASVTVTPATASVQIGQTLQMTATMRDAGGVQLGGRTVEWTSSNPSAATVNGSGLVSGIALGSVTITATSEGKSGSSTITMTSPPAPVASVEVAPGSASIASGRTLQLTATLKDASGAPLTDRSIAWTSSNTNVATVNSTGLATARSVGTATLSATSEGKVGTATLTVTPAPVALLSVNPTSTTIEVGRTVQVSVTAHDENGNVLSGRTVTWSSANTAIATVGSTGIITGVAEGSVDVTATCEGKTARVAVTVTPPPAPGSRAGFYVAPTGTSAGDGTSARPWNLSTALSGADGRIRPGDTVWVRGGQYVGPFVSTLMGTSAAPIVVRAYPGERVSISSESLTAQPLKVAGEWGWYWGLEVFVSHVQRYQSTGERPNCVYPSRPNNKFINLVLRDCQVGMSFSNESENSELYGSIIYNNGWIGPDRTHGHGIYTKNDGSTIKVIRDNVVFNQMRNGIQMFTEAGSGNLRGFLIEGNVFFNNGVLTSNENSASNMLLGGKEVADNVTASRNMLYFSPSVLNGSVRIGYNNTLENGRMTFEENYIVGGSTLLDVGYWANLTIARNFLYARDEVVAIADPTLAGHVWSSNMHVRDPNAAAWRHGGTAQRFADWRTATGLGATDQVVAQAPTETRVFVRPNLYEPGRGHVVIYNWGRLGAVSVDLGSVLRAGDRYEIRNVQDLWGTAVVKGTYGGGSVSIPMSGVAPPTPIGSVPNAAPRTGPDFDTFLVVRVP